MCVCGGKEKKEQKNKENIKTLAALISRSPEVKQLSQCQFARQSCHLVAIW